MIKEDRELEKAGLRGNLRQVGGSGRLGKFGAVEEQGDY